MNAADFLFRLYHHDKILDYEQFTDRLNALEKLKAGDLKPQMPST